MIGHHCRLTNREREVARWLLLGLTGKEICRILPISPRTADVHINNMKGKLGARNRAHLAALLLVKELVSMTVEELEESIRFEGQI